MFYQWKAICWSFFACFLTPHAELIVSLIHTPIQREQQRIEHQPDTKSGGETRGHKSWGRMFQFCHLIRLRNPKMKKRGTQVFTGFGEFCYNLPTDFVGILFTDASLPTETHVCTSAMCRSRSTNTFQQGFWVLSLITTVLPKNYRGCSMLFCGFFLLSTIEKSTIGLMLSLSRI